MEYPIRIDDLGVPPWLWKPLTVQAMYPIWCALPDIVHPRKDPETSSGFLSKTRQIHQNPQVLMVNQEKKLMFPTNHLGWLNGTPKKSKLFVTIPCSSTPQVLDCREKKPDFINLRRKSMTRYEWDMGKSAIFHGIYSKKPSWFPRKPQGWLACGSGSLGVSAKKVEPWEGDTMGSEWNPTKTVMNYFSVLFMYIQCIYIYTYVYCSINIYIYNYIYIHCITLHYIIYMYITYICSQHSLFCQKWRGRRGIPCIPFIVIYLSVVQWGWPVWKLTVKGHIQLWWSFHFYVSFPSLRLHLYTCTCTGMCMCTCICMCVCSKITYIYIHTQLHYIYIYYIYIPMCLCMNCHNFGYSVIWLCLNSWPKVMAVQQGW